MWLYYLVQSPKHILVYNIFFLFKHIALQLWANGCIINYSLISIIFLVNTGLPMAIYRASYGGTFSS
ncbi:hypothetical protein M23134_03808 [Microscilla marina ATCC 23134]|uniref:Uncharacterized protein n=1 Tax=Microscilla marina ATCC 23134 TaxID=313606 RepID=A1ZPK0_MICM2|nr:hypothetical protein M23134_03808 [Microscilla marina ATCC 23134]